ncbi:FHA domain-containing protein [Kiritimatiellota bacterium B12222]|nr:FHA domain-containing protein [Kiritimatiellota bacterium B12222]
MPYLLLLDKKGVPVREWKLGEHPLHVGRSERMDVCVDDPRLSRKHFKIEVREGRVWVSDLQSSTGLKVNGIAQESAHLKPGDMIEAGDTQFFYEAGVETMASEPLTGTQETTIGKIIQDLRVPEQDQ